MSENERDTFETEKVSVDIVSEPVVDSEPVREESSAAATPVTCYKGPTRTYYKKNKRPFPWLACLLSSVVTLAIVLSTITVYQFVLDYQAGKTPFNQGPIYQDNGPVAAGTLEQLAKKDGSEMSVPDIANKVGPAVCGILVEQQVYSMFGPSVAEGSGSGIIISDDGYIVTNQHVIADSDDITVILSTGEQFSATVVGEDVSTDLAVIKIDGEDLPVAEFGYSSELAVGELVVAIGNPLGQEFAGSVTVGVVSALNRTVTVENRSYTLIQTDAAINSGNSGGALVNSYGQVVGINSLKVLQAEGLGFAIPIDFAKPVIDELISNGYVAGRPVIGVTLREIDSTTSKQYKVPQGLYVADVSKGSAAEDADIRRGDVIIAADGQDVTTVAQLNSIKNQKKAGDVITLKIMRDEGKNFKTDWKEKTVKLTLGEEK